MIGVLIQVRLGSTRLPGKALLPLAGRPLIAHAMSALRAVDADCWALITDPDSAEALRPVAREGDYELFVGDPLHVLNRYVAAARAFGVTTILRATGDNPAVSAALAQSACDLHRQESADLTGWDDLPVGTGVEVIERAALEIALSESADPYEHEHVTPFLYRRQDRFRVVRRPAESAYRMPHARVTVDTEDDYRRIQRLFGDRYHGTPIEIEEVIEWLRGEQDSPNEGSAP